MLFFMKNVFLTLALCASFSCMAQVFTVGSIDKVNIPMNSNAKVAAISPQGDYLLLTDCTNKGLAKFDLRTNATTTLSNAQSAGYDVKISQDGQTVVYREATFTADHLRHVALQATNVSTGSSQQLLAPTRNLQGVAVEGATAAFVNKGKMRAKGLNAAKADVSAPVLSISNRQLMITKNGKTSVFSPNGTDKSYIWESVSPDGSKALYFVMGHGTYVCNIDGSGLKKIGNMRAPKWWDNNTIVGMMDYDDGEAVYASTIVAADLNGNKQTLTDGSQIAMYPEVSPASGKIAFSTPAGEAYIINVTK